MLTFDLQVARLIGTHSRTDHHHGDMQKLGLQGKGPIPLPGNPLICTDAALDTWELTLP